MNVFGLMLTQPVANPTNSVVVDVAAVEHLVKVPSITSSCHGQ
jgi:hypothetical protein